MTGEEEHLKQPQPAPAEAVAAEAGVSRRRFLSGSAATAALLIGAPAVAAAHAHGHPAEPPEPPESAKEQAAFDKAEADHYEKFTQPLVISGTNGVVDVTLRVQEAGVKIREPTGIRTEQTRTYNGEVPGPTISAYPGDKINVHFYNNLPVNSDASCVGDHHENPNTPHCFNTTNLHTHGLHVSPRGNSDNVLIEIPPNGNLDFCFALPKSHKPGTHWYHAHKHGSTALQLVNGMAGALIVKDLIEPYPGKADKVFVIHETVGNDAADVYKCGNGCNVKNSFLVNGQYQPTIDIRPGEIQRWRFINATATPRGITNLTFTTPLASSSLVQISQTLIAVDGIYLPEDRSVAEWLLPPGGRADFLVQFDTGLTNNGQTTVRKEAMTLPGCTIPAQILLKVNVAGPPLDMTLPTETPPLPRYLQKTLDAAKMLSAADIKAPDQTIIFDVAADQDCAGKFQIGTEGKKSVPFGPDAPPIKVPLGKTQTWEVQNSSGAPHPFHIHVNPFVVIERNGKKVLPGQQFFQDTVLVDANGSVKLTTTFDDFDGEFVIHCHILIHEDWGMMRKVVVEGNGVGPCVVIP